VIKKKRILKRKNGSAIREKTAKYRIALAEMHKKLFFSKS